MISKLGVQNLSTYLFGKAIERVMSETVSAPFVPVLTAMVPTHRELALNLFDYGSGARNVRRVIKNRVTKQSDVLHRFGCCFRLSLGVGNHGKHLACSLILDSPADCVEEINFD